MRAMTVFWVSLLLADVGLVYAAPISWLRNDSVSWRSASPEVTLAHQILISVIWGGRAWIAKRALPLWNYLLS